MDLLNNPELQASLARFPRTSEEDKKRKIKTLIINKLINVARVEAKKEGNEMSWQMIGEDKFKKYLEETLSITEINYREGYVEICKLEAGGPGISHRLDIDFTS
jgi:hypothetical protein